MSTEAATPAGWIVSGPGAICRHAMRPRIWPPEPTHDLEEAKADAQHTADLFQSSCKLVDKATYKVVATFNPQPSPACAI